MATSPVTEFLTASSLANPDFIYVGGSGGTYNFMNRIASGFAGVERHPGGDGELVRREPAASPRASSSTLARRR